MYPPCYGSFTLLTIRHLNHYSTGSTLFIISPKNFLWKEPFRSLFIVCRSSFFVHCSLLIVLRSLLTVLCSSFFVFCSLFIVHRSLFSVLRSSFLIHRFFPTALRKMSYMLHYIRSARGRSGDKKGRTFRRFGSTQARPSHDDPRGHRMGSPSLSLF